MEFTYHGDSSFTLKGERTVAINPDGAAAAEIVLRSEVTHGAKHTVNGPGEYEIGDVLIVTVRPDAKSAALVHAVNVDGINVLVADTASATLTEGDLSSMGKIDVLIVNSADARAAENLALDIAPRSVIPYGPNSEAVCAVLGVRDAQPQPRLTWNGTSVVPKAVLLKEQGRAQGTRKRSTRAA